MPRAMSCLLSNCHLQSRRWTTIEKRVPRIFTIEKHLLRFKAIEAIRSADLWLWDNEEWRWTFVDRKTELLHDPEDGPHSFLFFAKTQSVGVSRRPTMTYELRRRMFEEMSHESFRLAN